MNDDSTNITGPLSQMPGVFQNQTSSIDDYQAPQDQGLTGDTPTAAINVDNEAIAEEQVNLRSDSSDLPVDDNISFQTPAPVASITPVAQLSQVDNQDKSSGSQSLEDQNIFSMLGVTDGSEEERESFLDELQEVIWEDFLEKDVELLITKEEALELKRIQSNTDKKEEELQEEIVNYLEKLIPDLEEIMLEKALELKEDMFRERISDMKEFYADKTEVLESIKKAENLLAQEKWKDAAEVLNAIG